VSHLIRHVNDFIAPFEVGVQIVNEMLLNYLGIEASLFRKSI